jgi:hypothetical protein
MKNPICNRVPSHYFEKLKRAKYFSIFTIVILFLSFFLIIPASAEQNGSKKDNATDKRYALLEKLENGTSISSEEISSSMGEFTFNPYEYERDYESESHESYIFPPVPPIPPFMVPFYSRHYNDNDNDHVIISDQDIREIQRHLNQSIEALRKEVESFKNSEGYIRFQNDLQKWNDGFKQELDKKKEEWRKERKESNSNNSVHNLM